MPEYTLFSLLAIITGAVVGVAAVLFHELIGFFDYLFFEVLSSKIIFIGAAAIISIPLLGMLIQSLMTYLFPNTAKKRGVTEVIKAVATRGGYIPFRTTLFHTIAPAICIGSGGTVGPEGPAAQIGGGLASKLGQLFDLSDQRKRMFTAAGAGAAISAVFNTPLGGIFFALEVILLNDFHTATFSALILASVTASIISRIFLGDTPTFQFDTASIGQYQDFYLFIALGILAGILSIVFIKYSSAVKYLFNKNLLKKYPRWALMALVGLLVGVSGYFYNDILGIGYNFINKLLANSVTWQVAAILLVMKFLLVPLILGSGGFGGLFAPTLFIGACFGYLFAAALKYFWGMDVDTTTFVLVSMGAFLGGVNSIPISAILIIFEMTKDYDFILPLMLAVIISTTIVQLRLKGSVHIKHLEDEGFKISVGRDANILKSIQVKDVMSPNIFMIPFNTPVPTLISKLVETPHNATYTIDEEGEIIGVITESEIIPMMTDYDTLSKMLVASDIAKQEVIIVNENDDLDYVFKLFGSGSLDQFPVVSFKPDRKIVGSIKRQDVIAAYNREVIKHNVTEGLANELKALEQTSSSKIADGYSIIEKNVPRHFIGKSIIDLRIRNKYGLEVLMIKQKSSILADKETDEIIIPNPDYKINEDDILVLFGSDENIKKFKELY